jgi:hypothetical protein
MGNTGNQAEPTTAPASGSPVKITLIESCFGVPQFKEGIGPITHALLEKAKAEGQNIEFQSMLLDDQQTKQPALYPSGADFTMAFDAPWYKTTTLRAQNTLLQFASLFDQFGAKLNHTISDWLQPQFPIVGAGRNEDRRDHPRSVKKVEIYLREGQPGLYRIRQTAAKLEGEGLCQ